MSVIDRSREFFGHIVHPAGKERAPAKKAPAKGTRRNVAWNQIEKMLENARLWRHVSATQHDAIGEAYWHGQQDALERLRAERGPNLPRSDSGSLRLSGAGQNSTGGLPGRRE